jgi:very-short-patch-repair endonuclease
LRRQAVLGRFVVDFICYEARLVIEVDGGQHTENAEDMKRQAWIENQDFRVLRFWNNDVLANIEGVMSEIARHAIHPPPSPSRRGRGN